MKQLMKYMRMVGVGASMLLPLVSSAKTIVISQASPLGGSTSEGKLEVIGGAKTSKLILSDLDLDADGDASDSVVLHLKHLNLRWNEKGKSYLLGWGKGKELRDQDHAECAVLIEKLVLSSGRPALKSETAISGFHLSGFSVKDDESVRVTGISAGETVYHQASILLKSGPERAFFIAPGKGSQWGLKAFDITLRVEVEEPQKVGGFQKGEHFRVYGLSRQNGEVFSLQVSGRADGSEFHFGEVIRTDLGFHANGMTAGLQQDVLYTLGEKRGNGKQSYVTATSMLGGDGGIVRTHMGAGKAVADEMSVDRTGKYLVASHYRSGVIQTFPILEDKTLGNQIQQLNETRKNGHYVEFSQDNKSVYIPYVKDQSALYQFSFSEQTGMLTPHDPKDAGAEGGPRHLYAHPRGTMLYSSNEQQMGVSAYKLDELGRVTHVQSVEPEVLSAGEEVKAKLNSSFLQASADGQFLFVGTRDRSDDDRDRITSYQVAEDGSVKKVSVVAYPYKIPWGCALSPDGNYLIVNSVAFGQSGGVHRICAFHINQQTGALREVASLPIVEQMFSILSVPSVL